MFVKWYLCLQGMRHKLSRSPLISFIFPPALISHLIVYGFCDTLFRRSKPLKNSCGGSRLEKRENPLEGLTIGRGTYLRSLAKDPPIV